MLTFLLIYAKRRSEVTYDNRSVKDCSIISLLFKVLFEWCLCIKLEFFYSLSLYVILVPFLGFAISLSWSLMNNLIETED